jgi:hypothetical protein
MTAIRRLALTTVAALAVAAAPAAASTLPPAWHDAGAGAPTNVDFKAVATYVPDGKTEPVAVAVGTAPGATQGSQVAVIYRYVAGSWVQDQVLDSTTQAPIPGCLTEVAVTHDAAWAVGTKGACGSGDPLILRFPKGGEELAKAPDTTSTTTVATQWTPVTAPSGLAVPTALTFLDGSTQGYLGDSSGGIYPISESDTPVIGTKVPYQPAVTDTQVFPLTAVNGVAYTREPTADDPSTPADESAQPFALAGGGNDSPSKPHVFGISSSAAQPAPFQPDTGTDTIQDVAAALDAPASTPVAIEKQWLWTPNGNGVWTRQQPPATFSGTQVEMRNAAVGKDPATGKVAAAIAGKSGTGSTGVGTVWVRKGTGPWNASTDGGWTKYTSPASQGADYNDVAVAGYDDVWAVGAKGQIVRYSAVTVADPVTDTGGGSGGGTGGGDPGTGTPAPTGSSDSSGVQTTVVQQPTTTTSTSTQTRSTSQPTPPAVQPRLLRNVKVRVLKGRLVISFRLIASARVAVRAMRGHKLVGRTAARLMRRGKGKVVLRYRGKRPPTQLQLIVRPVRGAGR